MKRYNFDNFHINERNQSACETCRRISNLDFPGPFPVTLVGEAGSGKTHLIYSIVNHVRETSTKVALAVVTAAKFPPEVRALANDPGPLARAKAAILLVDQLEEFSHHITNLDAIVRVFVDRNHYVVIASEVPPDQVSKLPQSLRDLISQGTIVSISPSQTSEPRSEVSAAEIDTSGVEEYLAELQRQVDSLRIRLDDEQRSNTTFERDLSHRKRENSALQQELNETKNLLESLLDTNSELEQHVQALRRELAQARQENEATAVRIQEMTQQVESYSAYFAQGEEVQRKQLEELENLVNEAMTRPAMEELERAQAELDETRRILAATQEQLEAERAKAQSERSAAEDSLARRDIENKNLQTQMEALQAKFNAQSIEMDALQREAAAQVAAAHAQAGEIEREIARLTAAHEAERTAGTDVLADLLAARDQLARVVKSFSASVEYLSQIYGGQAPQTKDPPDNLAVLDRLNAMPQDEELSGGSNRAATSS